MSQKDYVDEKVKGLSKIIPTIKLVKHQAEDLVNTVNDVSNSSEKISGKIRTLDVARVSKKNCNNNLGSKDEAYVVVPFLILRVVLVNVSKESAI